MFTGIILVCCYHVFTKFSHLQGGEENVALQKFYKPFKSLSEYQPSSVTQVRMTAVLNITQDYNN